MHLRASLVVVLLLATPSWAGTIALNFGAAQTITTSAAQDAALERLRVQTNTRAGRVMFATVEDMLRAFLQEQVQQRVGEAKQADAVDACASYQALTPGQQATINTSLGGRSPCP